MRALLILLACGCAGTRYQPRVVARGELVLTDDGGLQMHAGGKRVARSLEWKGLSRYVRCVPEARAHAGAARQNGTASIALAATGGTLGVLSLGGLAGLADHEHQWQWLGAGVASAVVGVVMAGLSRLYRNRANGNAVDAMNYYNDAVGSLGATCDDLVYPKSAGPKSAGPKSAGPKSSGASP